MNTPVQIANTISKTINTTATWAELLKYEGVALGVVSGINMNYSESDKQKIQEITNLGPLDTSEKIDLATKIARSL